jgi:hypothetical protein
MAMVTCVCETHEPSLQQKVFMCIKWFHWIMSEFIGYSERDLVGK